MFKSYDQVHRFQYLFCYKPYVLVCFGVLHIEWWAKLRNDCKCFILEAKITLWFSVFETFELCVWWIITSLRDSEEFEWDDQILPMCSNTCKPVPVFFCLCIITEEWIWMYWKYVLTWYTITALRLPVLWPYSVECNKYSLTFEWDLFYTWSKNPSLGWVIYSSMRYFKWLFFRVYLCIFGVFSCVCYTFGDLLILNLEMYVCIQSICKPCMALGDFN